jgi:phosphoribosylamine-glycine ligase
MNISEQRIIFAAIAASLLAVAVIISLPNRAAVPQRIVFADEPQAREYAGQHEQYYGVMGTGSMYPLIPRGNPQDVVAYVIVDDTEFGDLKKDSLVVYLRSDFVYVTHAVVNKTKDGWQLKGWANRAYDHELLTADNYLGRVSQVLVW